MRVSTGIEDNLASHSESVNSDVSSDQVIIHLLKSAGWGERSFAVVGSDLNVVNRLKEEGVYDEYKAWSAKNPQNFEPGWHRRFALLRGRKQFEEWRR
jgi:hypothetical protein